MVLRSSLLVFGAVSLAVATQAWAAAGDTVDATGEAQVGGGDVVAAKKAATLDALRRAVEKIVGITIQSDFTSEQKEVVDGNKDQFYSSVRDSITQKAEGYVQSYEVISEERQGDVLKITIRAKVFESKVKAELSDLASLLDAAGNPKLMLVLQEVYVSKDGAKRVAKESVVAAYLEKELVARRFELRGATAAKNLADDSVAAYDQWLGDAGGAAKMARDNGADIIIAGRIEVVSKGKIEEADAGGLTALIGQSKIEIVSVVRGVNAVNGDVLSTKPVQMTSMGSNDERALHRALQGRGNNVIKQTFDTLLADLKASFKKTAAEGQSYVVQLRGVTSYRKQAQGFLNVLKKVSGLTVKKDAYDDGAAQLVVDIAFKGSASELQERIFNAAEKMDGFSKLDVQSISGKMLSFKL